LNDGSFLSFENSFPGGSCVGSFGERLQREREMRGITLDEIAEATKIGTRSLRALEAQEYEKLPGGIFNKGFVRSYARFLGLDEEQAVADYEAAAKEKLAGKGKAFLIAGPEQDDNMEEERAAIDRSRRTGIVVVLLAAGALVLAFFLWTHYSHPVNPAGPQREPSTPEPAPSEPVAVPPEPRSEPGTPKGPANPASAPDAPPDSGAARKSPSEGKPATATPDKGDAGSPEPRQTPAPNQR
jgi:cytoskeleton protein RodZ